MSAWRRSCRIHGWSEPQNPNGRLRCTEGGRERSDTRITLFVRTFAKTRPISLESKGLGQLSCREPSTISHYQTRSALCPPTRTSGHCEVPRLTDNAVIITEEAAGLLSKIAITSLDGRGLDATARSGAGCRVLPSFLPSRSVPPSRSLRLRQCVAIQTKSAHSGGETRYKCLLLSLETLLTSPRALLLLYSTQFYLALHRRPFHCLPQESHNTICTWHLFLFHIVCSVCRLCAVDRGRRLSPFITCYLRCRFASGLAHFRANRMHVCQRPQQLLHFSRLLDLQLSVACAKFVVVVLLLLLLFLMHRPKGD